MNTSTEIQLTAGRRLRQNRLYSSHFAEIDQRRIEIISIAQTSVLVSPILQKILDIAMRRDKTVGPEWNTALFQSDFDLLGGRLKDGSASDHHLEFSIHSSQARQNSFPNLADELYRQATGLTLGWNTVFGKTRWSQFSCK